ncbi:transcriptional regulator, SarA/Rot family [Cohnella luojiensis]|uniref:transcriptional regulator, SarA/Rot family n=1 Tax=Cohnella luojiensis TaxID=652876 RepID=UPI003B835CE3
MPVPELLLDLDSGTLTPLLKRMEINKLIRRERSKEDERVVVIKLTNTGAALKEKALVFPRHCSLPAACRQMN